MNNKFLSRIDRQLEFNEMVKQLAHYLQILTTDSSFYTKKAIEQWEKTNSLQLADLSGQPYNKRWIHLKEIGGYMRQNLKHLDYDDSQIEQALYIATTSLDLLYRI